MHLSLQQVPPKDIQTTLDRIWESMETKNVARACLFNLIFYTKKSHRLGYSQKLIHQVIEKFPSRVLFILADHTAPTPGITTSVSILSSGSIDVACDYIQIDAEGSCCDQIPFLVLPHIVPDLPVYLVLAEDPTEDDPISSALRPLANRLIFDSERAHSLPLFAKTLLHQHETFQQDIADLNWARLKNFRDMLATAFYSEEKKQHIRHARTLSVRYNAQKTPFFYHTHIQALYLIAWLSCQLGWQWHSVVRQEEVLCVTYQGPSCIVTVHLIPEERAQLPPGLILSLHVRSIEEELFSFDRESIDQILFTHSTPSRCSLPFRYIFEKTETGSSLIKEICHRGTSSHWIHVLRHLQMLHEVCLCP